MPLFPFVFVRKQKASGFNPTPAHARPYLSSFTTTPQPRFPRTPARASDLSGGFRNGDGRISAPRRRPVTIVRRNQADDRRTHLSLRLPQLIELLKVQPEFARYPEEAAGARRPFSISKMRHPEATSQHLLLHLPSNKVQSWVGGANWVFHMVYSRRWCFGSLRNMSPAYC